MQIHLKKYNFAKKRPLIHTTVFSLYLYNCKIKEIYQLYVKVVLWYASVQKKIEKILDFFSKTPLQVEKYNI